MRWYLLLLIFWAGTQVQAQFQLNGKTNRALQELLEFSEVFSSATVGFALYDVESGGYLYGYNARKHFVPASNVKLLTFYLANRQLHHRTPAVFFQEYPDRIELWGGGYPLTLHPAFAGLDELTPWLAARDRPIVLNLPEEDAVPRYGAGWSWDDYNYGSVFERSAMPVYGNRLYLDVAPPDSLGNRNLVGYPASLMRQLSQDTDQESGILRREDRNEFTVGPALFRRTPDRFPVERSLVMSPDLVAGELGAALPDRPIRLSARPRPPLLNLNYLEVSLPDTVYRRLLTDSDNFLAEQLLLQSAARRYGTLDEDRILDYGQDTLLQELELGPLRWADASGLSRYNLVQPDQFARLLLTLDREVGRERLLDLLATGGDTGTLAERFDDQAAPYVWAKTGTLSGVICLSGLVRTRQDRWLSFSLLINNKVGASKPFYEQADRVVRFLRDNL